MTDKPCYTLFPLVVLSLLTASILVACAPRHEPGPGEMIGRGFDQMAEGMDRLQRERSNTDNSATAQEKRKRRDAEFRDEDYWTTGPGSQPYWSEEQANRP